MKKKLIFVRTFAVILFLITFQFSYCQWSWINPLPNGSNFEGVSFVNDSTGWIISNKGKIYKTTDYGKSWILQNGNISSRLNEIHMVNEFTGYIVGDSSVVLKTSNGGTTWELLDLGLTYSASLISVYFIDELKGWISGGFSSVFYTKDGGQSWSTFEFWWADWVGDIQFTDSLTGYRAGRFVQKTTDGGKTWDDLNLPLVSNYNDVFFINKDTGWVICENQLSQTTDGGLSWTLLSSISYAVQIYFTCADTGWLLGYNEISKTTDGGTTWSNFSIPSCYKICMTPSMGYAVGENGVIAQLPDNTFNNWSRLDKNFVGANNLFDIYFNDPLVGFAAGDSGKIFRTHDGGISWDCIKIATSKTLHKIFFTDSKNGWTISDNTIYNTVNGGDTWQISYSADTYFKDIFFIDSETGWVVSSSSQTLYTNNKGVTWTQQGNYGTVGNSLAFTTSKYGWSVGSDGKTLRTVNGGLTWSTKTLPTTNDLLDIEFYDEKTGWIIGRDGIIMKTINDGLNWTIQTAPVFDYKKISVIDSNTVWIAGSSYNIGGLTLTTNNGGESWKSIENDCYQQLNSLFFNDVNNGFAVGYNGAILKYAGLNTIPVFPTALQAGSLSETKIVLSWQDNSSNEEGFEILRSDNYSGNYKIIKIVGAGSTNCIDSLLTLDTDYWYRVRAYNSSGKSAWTREDSAKTSGTRMPETPLLISPSNFETDIPVSSTFTWNSSKRASTYRLQVDDDYNFSSPVFDVSGLTSTSQQVNNLDNNKYHYWRVNASNAGGTSAWSDDRVFKTLDSGLDPPALLSPEKYANDMPISLTLSWISAGGAESYRLQVDDDYFFNSPVFDQSGITSLSQTVTGLNLSTFYYWRVKSENSIGNSDWPDSWAFTTTGPIPDIPVLVSPENNYTYYNADVMLLWNSSDIATSYHLQVDDNNDFSSPVFDDSEIIYISQWLSNLDSSTVYYWRVSGSNTSGTSGWSVTWEFKTVSPQPVFPDIPSLVSPENAAWNQPTTITLCWNSSLNALFYQLQVDEYFDYSSPIFDLSGIKDTSQMVSGLLNNTRYFWRVNASNTDATSFWSFDWIFTTVPEAPEAPVLNSPLSGVTFQPTSLLLMWFPLFNVTFQLQVDNNIDFSSPVFDQSDIYANLADVAGLEYNVTYYWRVRAINDGGAGNWSDIWNFKTTEYTGIGSYQENNTAFLKQNIPNPFENSTLFRYYLPNPSHVKMQIFTINGKLVYNLVNEMQIAGHHEMEWKGMDHSGFPLPSGLYLVRLLTNEFCEFKKLEIIRN